MSVAEITRTIDALGLALARLREATEEPLQMLKDRNETSHTYSEPTARRVYASIRKNLPELEVAYQFISSRARERQARGACGSPDTSGAAAGPGPAAENRKYGNMAS